AGAEPVEERCQLRHRHLADRRLQPVRRPCDRLHEKQSRTSQGCLLMSFSLTDEQSMIQSAARDFAMNEVLPIANEYDPERRDIPQSLLAKLSEMGFFGITIPQEYGGLGLGCLEYCLVTEELSRAWMSVSSIIRPMLG